MLLVAGVVVLTIGLFRTGNSAEGREVILECAAWWKGYDGCRCADCVEHFLGVPNPADARGACMPSFEVRHRFEIALAVTTFGGMLILGARLLRFSSQIASRCAGECGRCGYSLAGMPEGSPCSECGTTIEPMR